MKKIIPPPPQNDSLPVKRSAAKLKNVPHLPALLTGGARPFIAAIGASAGGLEALTQFFTHLPAKSGVAFVVVMHRSPDVASMLAELLGKHTALPVTEALDNTRVLPDHIYLAPAHEDLAILHGVLHYMVRTTGEKPGPHLPIDYFLTSLAQDQKERGICIILSGTGTDGTLGLRAIKSESGMAMAQDVLSAHFSGMPQSAIDTGLCDYILPVEQLPRQLVSYSQSFRLRPEAETRRQSDEGGLLGKIFVLLRSRTGHDFSHYKLTTMRRRIERRMQVHQLAELKEYVRFLTQNPHELDILFKELLIGVTGFFRDRECFAALANVALPPLLSAKPSEQIVRVWVAGCSTGEEAYSIAITLAECMERLKRNFPVQIYATDLDSHAINIARAGVYPEGIAADVGSERLQRYFSTTDSGYRINKEIREMVIFAPQNIISDPPFTKLDLLSCRNVLIYLIAPMQGRLLSQFHYSLKPGGVLLLGASGTVGALGPYFEPLDKQWKLYRKKESLPAVQSQGVLTRWLPAIAGQPNGALLIPGHKSARPASITELATRLLLDFYVPPSVLVNEKGDITYLHGRTGEYLELPPGQPSHNLLEMARGGLQIDLGLALKQAASQTGPVVHKGVRFTSSSGEALVDLSVRRVLEPEALRGLLLVMFEPAKDPPPEGRRRRTATVAGEQSRLKEVERDLRYAKESLQATIDEAQTANEELRTANEELQATNEEMQSTNEELETSKEEVQSLNEELQTVNAELQDKLKELSQIHDDMTNLLDSTSIATVFLDNQLRIKRFTSQARKLIRLIPSDLGRPFGDIATRLSNTNLLHEAATVLRTLALHESEVQTSEHEHFLMRIIPYVTANNRVDGVVMTFVNITRFKKTEKSLPAKP